MNDDLKIINFIQDFGCVTLKQLQILFNRPNDNLKNILSSNVISRKNDIFVHNTATVDIKMISALEILCKYKNRFKYFHKGFEPVYITFLSKDNLLYNIIVSDKNNEQGVVKLLKIKSPMLSESDKLILLFEDENCFEKVESETPYIYCTYPEIKIVSKKIKKEEL